MHPNNPRALGGPLIPSAAAAYDVPCSIGLTCKAQGVWHIDTEALHCMYFLTRRGLHDHPHCPMCAPLCATGPTKFASSTGLL